MSYILDALQRADAERERGQVPGLRSHAAPFSPEPQRRRSATTWWQPALAIGLTGLLLLAGWWWLSPSPPTARSVAPAPLVPATAGVQQPASAASGSIAATSTADAAASGPSWPILAPAAPAAPPAAPAKQVPQPPAQVSAGGTQPTAPNETPVTASQEARVASFGELPADVRARLPQVSVSGATYSSNPAHRMLIVNGQVLQEGQEIQSGLRLVSIGPRSATLEHQGLRYTIGY